MSTSTDPKTPKAHDWPERRSKATSNGARALGRDLPRVPRRYGQWAAAVLFVVVAVLAAGWLWQQKSDRVEVLSLAHDVPAGQVVASDDFEVVEVAGVKGAVPIAEVDSIAGSTAAVGLVEGQILTLDMVTVNPLPGPGERLVGMQMDATRAPVGLAPGDIVAVIAVPPSGDPSAPDQLDEPTVLADTGTVASTATVEGAGTRLTLLVPMSVAERVASYAASGRVALVQAPVGGDN